MHSCHLNPNLPLCFPMQRHTAQLREELLKLPCPDGLEPESDEFSDKSCTLMLKELPSQDAEKPSGSQDGHCSEGQLWVSAPLSPFTSPSSPCIFSPLSYPLMIVTIVIENRLNGFQAQATVLSIFVCKKSNSIIAENERGSGETKGKETRWNWDELGPMLCPYWKQLTKTFIYL